MSSIRFTAPAAALSSFGESVENLSTQVKTPGVREADGWTGTSTGFSQAFSLSADVNVLYVAIGGDQGITTNVTGVTYNGVSMSLIASEESNQALRVYKLNSPATGSNTLAVTWDNGSQIYHIMAAAFSGVNTAAGETGIVTYTSDNSEAASVQIASAQNHLAIAFCNANNNPNPTPTLSCTAPFLYQEDVGSTRMAVAAQAADATSTSITFTTDQTAGRTMGAIGFMVQGIAVPDELSFLVGLKGQWDVNTRGRTDNDFYEWVDGTVETTVNGTVVAEDDYGHDYMSFNGSSSYMITNSLTKLLKSDFVDRPFTMAVRFKTDHTAADNQMLFGFYDQSAAAADTSLYIDYNGGNEYPSVRIDDGLGGQDLFINEFTNLVAGEEHLWLFRRDEAGDFHVYTDGAWTKSDTSTVPALIGERLDRIAMGREGVNTNQYFAGDILWAAVWDRAITYSEQKRLYEQQNPFAQEDLTYRIQVGQEVEHPSGPVSIPYPEGDLTGKMLVIMGWPNTITSAPDPAPTANGFVYLSPYGLSSKAKTPKIWLKKADGTESGTVSLDFASGAITAWMVAIDPPDGQSWPDAESAFAGWSFAKPSNSSTSVYYGPHATQEEGNCLLRFAVAWASYSGEGDLGEIGVTAGHTRAGQWFRDGVVGGMVSAGQILNTGLTMEGVPAVEETVSGLGTSSQRYWLNLELRPANTTKVVRQAITENTTAQADNIDETFTGIDDAALQEENPTTNYQNSSFSETSYWAASQEQKTLIKADLSNIPADATILSAQIRLNSTVGVGDNVGYTVEVYRVLRNWVLSEVTWNVYSTGNSWATAGAEGTGDRATTPTFVFEDLADYENVYYAFDVTNDVIGMHSGEYANYGWVLERLEETVSEYRQWAASQNTTNGIRPEVIITYSVPAYVNLDLGLVHQADLGTRGKSITVPFEHVSRQAGVINGTLGEVQGNGGLRLKSFDDTTGDHIKMPKPGAAEMTALLNRPHTMAQRSARNGTMADHAPFGIGDNTSSNVHYVMYHTSTDEITYNTRDLDVEGSSRESTYNLPNQTEVVAVGQYDFGQATRLTLDGEYDLLWADDSTPADNMGEAHWWTMGALRRGTSPQTIWEMLGYVSWTAFWNRVLGEDEVKELNDRPNPFTSDPHIAEIAEYKSLDQNTVHYVNLPTRVRAGELMLMFFQTYSTGASANRVQTPPTGWTLVNSYGYGGSNVNNWCGWYKKIATAEDAGSYAVVTTDVGAWSNAATFRIPNGDFDRVDADYTLHATDSSAPNPPLLSHSYVKAPDVNNLWIAAYSFADDLYSPSAYPSGFSEVGSIVGNGTANLSCEMGWAARSDGETTKDPGTFTIGGVDIGTAWTVAVGGKPLAGAPDLKLVQSVSVDGDATTTAQSGNGWATPTVGNLLIAMNGVRKGTSTTNVTVSVGGTFNLAVGEYGADVGSVNGGLWWKVADGTESTITLANSNSANDNGMKTLFMEFEPTNLDLSQVYSATNVLDYQSNGPHGTDLSAGTVSNTAYGTTQYGIVLSGIIGQIDSQWSAETSPEAPFAKLAETVDQGDSPFVALAGKLTNTRGSHEALFNCSDTGGLAYLESVFFPASTAVPNGTEINPIPLNIYENRANGADVTVSFTAPTSGNLLIAAHVISGNGTASNTIQAPAGWNNYVNQDNSSNNNRTSMFCYWKVSDGTETSVALGGAGTANDCVGIVLEFSSAGLDLNALDDSDVDTSKFNVLTNQFSSGSATPTEPNALGIAIFGQDDGSNLDDPFLANVTEGYEIRRLYGTGQSGDPSVCVATKLITSATAQSPDFISHEGGTTYGYGSIAIFKESQPAEPGGFISTVRSILRKSPLLGSGLLGRK